MKVNIAPGKYIVAVSGGVDSMALLHLLAKLALSTQLTADSSMSLQLIVAHFDHGIRQESEQDEKLVRKTAKKYGLIYETAIGKLGSNTSEAKAREARYKFLKNIKNKYKAKSIITAHHQDDVIETAIINMIRGTGSRGLSSIKNNPDVIRPLLGISKDQIIEYAKKHKLVWREDETNQSDVYLRNYIRKNILIKLNAADRKLIINNLDKVAETNKNIDLHIATLSQEIIKDNQINRQKFTMLPLEVAVHLLMHWFRSRGYSSYNQKIIKRTCVSIKTASPQTFIVLNGHFKLLFEQSVVSLVKD